MRPRVELMKGLLRWEGWGGGRVREAGGPSQLLGQAGSDPNLRGLRLPLFTKVSLLGGGETKTWKQRERGGEWGEK